MREAARAFLAAGAEVLVAPTAETVGQLFAESARLEDGAIASSTEAVRACAAACVHTASEAGDGIDVPVIGAIGPPNRLLRLKEIQEDLLFRACAAQAAGLRDAGVSAIVCASYTELEALRIAVEGALEGGGLPVIGCLTFDCGPDWAETTMGDTPPQAVEVLSAAGAAMAGCTCGSQPDGAPGVVGLLKRSGSLPVWVSVDAGMPELIDGRRAFPETPEAFAERLSPLVTAGAAVVGGCCGASAAHVAALAAMARRLRRRGGEKRRER